MASAASNLEDQLAALSPADWAGWVEQVTRQPGWMPLTWKGDRLHRTFGGATAGVFRIHGTAQKAGDVQSWSLILKVISPVAWVAMTKGEPAETSHPLYWKREVLAYQSGWLELLPGNVRGPHCLGIEEQPDGRVWLWLEEAQDHYSGRWPLEQFARAAHCLGAFNGAYLAEEPWPPYPWLAEIGTPRGVIEAFGWIEPLVRNPATWDHPILRAGIPRRLAARLPEFWEYRHDLLAALDRLPQTLCHHDAWRGNAFCPPGSPHELVLIDWSYAGRAVLGADLADLAVAGYPLLPADINHPPAEIDRAVFDAYVAGLHEVGCTVPRDQVRFAYCTCAALKYGCLLIWLRDIDKPDGLDFWERFAGQPVANWLKQQALVLEHQLNLLDEARRLLPKL